MSGAASNYIFLFFAFGLAFIVPPIFELDAAAFAFAFAFLFRLAFGLAFIVPVFDAIAVLLVLAAGFLAAFLFCAANALVPARARANTTLIRILFIIVLRRSFLAAD
jgi:hypothetical protein